MSSQTFGGQKRGELCHHLEGRRHWKRMVPIQPWISHGWQWAVFFTKSSDVGDYFVCWSQLQNKCSSSLVSFSCSTWRLEISSPFITQVSLSRVSTRVPKEDNPIYETFKWRHQFAGKFAMTNNQWLGQLKDISFFLSQSVCYTSFDHFIYQWSHDSRLDQPEIGESQTGFWLDCVLYINRSITMIIFW